jgi:hypothetical protein
MAEPTLDSIGQWILDNKDKAGSPDFVKMSEAYRQMSANPSAASAAAPAEDAAYNARNTVGRISTDMLLGIPDLAIAASNVISKPGDWVAELVTGEKPGARDLPTLAPQLREKLNVAELPEDAPWYRRIGESAASSLNTGGAGIARAVAGGLKSSVTGGLKEGGKELLKNTVVPTITSDAGARVGGAVGGQTGQLIGGIIGGAAPSARPMAENWVQGRYVGKGDPNAPQIAAAADRLGIEPTAGALGNYDIQKRENNYAAQRTVLGNESYSAREQARIRNEMTGAGENIATQRGGTGGGQAAIGDDIVGAAADRVMQDRQYSSAQQENLQRTVGDATPVPVWDIIQEARAAMNAPGATVPMRESLQFRIGQLTPLITQRMPDGTPIVDRNSTVPYAGLKGWRTDLGRSFDSGNQPRARELYEPATNAMGDTAQQAGVPRGEFNQVQQFTRGVEGEGGLADRLAPFEKEPVAAYNYLLEGGRNNPDRLSTFATETAGDPRQSRVFGNYLQSKVDETLGANQAQSANKFASFVEGTDPRALDTIAGPQVQNVRDLATLARGVDVPTSQRGLGTSVSGVTGSLGSRWLGSEVLGRVGDAIDPILGTAGRGIGWMAKPSLDWAQQRIMQSDAAKRGLLGAPMQHRVMSIDDLIRTLSIIGQNQPPQDPLRITVTPR